MLPGQNGRSGHGGRNGKDGGNHRDAAVFGLDAGGPNREAAPEAAAPQAAIGAELEAQVAAWNRGDLKGYMQGYWHSPELTFFAGQKESAGWEAAYQRYRAAYVGKDKEMGKLKFSGASGGGAEPGRRVCPRRLAAHHEGRNASAGACSRLC